MSIISSMSNSLIAVVFAKQNMVSIVICVIQSVMLKKYYNHHVV